MVHISSSDLDEVALSLAIEARELAGLPIHRASVPNPSSSSSSTFSQVPIPILQSPPTSLEFARIVSRNRPVLIRGAVDQLPAFQKWTSTQYLCNQMGDRQVAVSLTPDGRADSILEIEVEDDKHQRLPELGRDQQRLSNAGAKDKRKLRVFALPHEEKMTFAQLVEGLNLDQTLSAEGTSGSSPVKPLVPYLQSQNSNLTRREGGDLAPLLDDLCSERSEEPFPHIRGAKGRTDLEWASEALGSLPEATNLWVGAGQSASSMHRDHYENLFSVIRGSKTFTLYPPTEAHFLCDDESYPIWTWSPVRPSSPSTTSRSNLAHKCVQELHLRPIPDAPPTPWIPVHPELPAHHPLNRPFKRFAKGLAPITVTVNRGETLFLPAGWFHHVAQSADGGGLEGPTAGLCVCVNWWYESEASFGDRWAWQNFMRELGSMTRKAVET